MGVEEELLLVDPDTGRTRSVSDIAVRKDLRDGLDQELFLHQLEIATDPHTGVLDLRADLQAKRGEAVAATRSAGAEAIAVGTPLLGGVEKVTPKKRYLSLMDEFGQMGHGAVACGMHVHVDIESPAEGVGVLDRIRPWLPVVAALTSNSPFVDGSDTGYASWRTQVWNRWPSAGVTAEFGDVETYRAVVADMIESGAAVDEGMVYFDARLSRTYPTVEIRSADVCTEMDDAVAVAALIRGLVETCAREWHEGRPAETWRIEVLRGARWRASRFGTSGELYNPVTRAADPAAAVVDALRGYVADALDNIGDAGTVDAGLKEILAHGTGAERQRRLADETGDLSAVQRELIARTDPDR